MSILVIRHGLSQANNRENIGTPAFGHRDAALMDAGREQARAIPAELSARYGIAPDGMAVATSTLYRTKETAREAGFAETTEYAVLDEIEQDAITRPELRRMLDAGRLPQVALDAAELTLASPPPERIWFSHGLRIAGLCAILGVYQGERPIPRFCEIRELPL
jgi:hypothetical protein